MNTPPNPRRFVWLLGIAGALLAGILVVAVFAPDSGGGYEPGPQLSPAVIGAQDVGTEPAESGTGSFSLDAGGLASLAWRLALVVAIIGASIVALRWWAKRTTGPRSNTGFLRVVDTLTVGNGRTIHLVSLGGRVIVVGATPQALSFLNELTGDESQEILAQADRPADEALSGFASELLGALRRDHPTVRRDSALESVE